MTPLIGSLLNPRIRAIRANPDLLALWFAYALMLFSMAAMGPVLGEVKDEFNLTPASTALLVAVQGMGRGGFMLILAPLADRMSPRRLMPLGLLLTGVASVVTAVAPSEWVFGVGIVASAAGSGLVGPGGQVHLARRGSGEDRRRNIARVMSGGMFGAFVAPIAAGGAASLLGWRAAFVLVAVLSIAAAAGVASVRTLESSAPEPASREGTTPSRRRRPGLGVGRVVLEVSVLAVLLWGWNNTTRGFVLPYYGSEALKLDPGGIGLLMGLALGGRAALTYVSGAFVNRFGLGSSLLIATIIGAVGTLVMYAPAGLPVFAGLVVAYTLTGISSPIVIMMLTERAPPQRLGQAMGITQFLVDGVGLGLTPLIGLIVGAAGFGVVGALLAAISLAAGAWGLWIMRHGESEGSTAAKI
ncbi:MAG: MFS transporter [Chloroflexota bacterium]|nr:MFS transporter [Chloroflexota bacterium]MDE2918819.1 MFS transporter [Chloroflexota bacterium]